MEILIPILEQIRDQQKQQLADFERALEIQHAAAELRRRGRKVLIYMVAMPWVLVVGLLLLLLCGADLRA